MGQDSYYVFRGKLIQLLVLGGAGKVFLNRGVSYKDSYTPVEEQIVSENENIIITG